MIHPVGVSGDPIGGRQNLSVEDSGRPPLTCACGSSKASGVSLRMTPRRGVGDPVNECVPCRPPSSSGIRVKSAGRMTISCSRSPPPSSRVPDPLPYFVLGERHLVQSLDRGVLHPLHSAAFRRRDGSAVRMGQDMHVSLTGVPEDDTGSPIYLQALVMISSDSRNRPRR